jgi:hypothetical protein
VLFLAARVALRGWHRAALLVTLLLVLFFSYGQVYELKKTFASLTVLLRHRYLFPFLRGYLSLVSFLS